MPFDSIAPWLAATLARLEAAAAADRLGHGWLITGPAGVGKRNLVYLFAERLLRGTWQSGPPPEASPQHLVDAYDTLNEVSPIHPDLHRVVPEDGKTSIAVDQIRDVTARIGLTAHLGASKVVVVDGADLMTTAAANALLKSLEEPTPATFLLLIAERPGRLPATVRSRCQQLPIRTPGSAVIASWLARHGLDQRIVSAPGMRTPIAAARAVQDDGLIKEYKSLYEKVELLIDGKADPYAIADEWHKGDPERALGCLIDTLQRRIRQRLAGTLVTDSESGFNDNNDRGSATAALFEGLETAERLREQIGRGTNVELALKALLLGLEPLPGRTA